MSFLNSNPSDLGYRYGAHRFSPQAAPHEIGQSFTSVDLQGHSYAPVPYLGSDYHSQGSRRNSGGVGGREYDSQNMLHSRYSHSPDILQDPNTKILSERTVNREVRVPKKIVREDVIENVRVVPEKVTREEIVEETKRVRQKIVEIAKPIIQEKIIEVPEVEYVEKIIEVPEKVIQEKIRQIPKIERKERIIEVPKIVTRERVVEVPEVEYREYPVEKVVEVPQYREKVVRKEVPVPQYADKPIKHTVTTEKYQDVARHIPVPVQATSTFEFEVTPFQPQYNVQEIPLYVPRFIEVPVPEELMDEESIQQAKTFQAKVHSLAGQHAPSLRDVEEVAASLHSAPFGKMLTATKQDLPEVMMAAWAAGRLGGQQPNIAALNSNSSAAIPLSQPF